MRKALGALALVLGMVATPMAANAALAGKHQPRTFEARTLLNSARMLTAVWTSSSGTSVNVVGTSDVLTVRGRSLTLASNGRAFERINYQSPAKPWSVIGRRLLVTRSQVQGALLSSARKMRLPMSLLRPQDDGSGPTTFTTVNDYATDGAALARATPFAIRGAGKSLGLYSLVDTYLMNVADNVHNTTSGPVATFVYSANPLQFGNGDDQIVINVATAGSDWGNRYSQMMTRRTPNDDGTVPTVIVPGIVKVNANQLLLLRFGAVYVGITTTFTPADSDWKTFIASLRPY